MEKLRPSLRIQPVQLCWLGLCLMAVSLSTSKAGLSIGTFIVLGAGLWQAAARRFHIEVKAHRFALVLTSLFGLSLLGGIVTADTAGWVADLRIKLPLLVVPLAVSLCAPFSKKQFQILAGLFILCQVGVAGASLLVGYADYDHLFKRVSQNSSVQVITNLNHIYFGPILGLAGLLGLNLGFRLWETARKSGWLFLTGGLLASVMLHLFTSRTGFLAFYAGAAGWAFWLIFAQKRWLPGGIAVGIMILAPLIAINTIPTFKTRLDVTVWDLEQYQQIQDDESDQDFSDLTVGLRLVAWEGCYRIWQQQPVLGTGLGDVDEALMQEYKRMRIKVDEQQLLRSAHSQYMEYLAGAGVVGILWLLGVLAWPLFDPACKAQSLVWIHTAMVAAAFLSESFLERQTGLAFYIVFGVLFATLGKK